MRQILITFLAVVAAISQDPSPSILPTIPYVAPSPPSPPTPTFTFCFEPEVMYAGCSAATSCVSTAENQVATTTGTMTTMTPPSIKVSSGGNTTGRKAGLKVGRAVEDITGSGANELTGKGARGCHSSVTHGADTPLGIQSMWTVRIVVYPHFAIMTSAGVNSTKCSLSGSCSSPFCC